MSTSETHDSVTIAEEAPVDATLREKIAHEIEVLPCDWMGPRQTDARAVLKEYVLDTDIYDWDVARDCNPVADDWIIGAMEAADREPRYAPLVKAVIGSDYFTHDLMEKRVDTWQRMIEICHDKLNAIAERGEREIFEPNRFSERIGDLGSEYFGVPVRMDNVPGMLPKDLWEDLIDVVDDDYDDLDFPCVFLVQFLTFVADARFQAAMAEIAKESGGEVRAAPPKMCARMIGKMENDHIYEESPKPCCNIDCVRTGITFEDVDGIAAGYSVATSRFRPLRVKNTFRSDYNAVEKTFGYRCILLNLLYTEEGVTWGDVLDASEDETKRYWTDAGLDEQMYEDLKTHERFWNAPFAYVGEIQFLHREYLKMRKHSHFWYKIHRAKDFHGITLRLDFDKYNPAFYN